MVCGPSCLLMFKKGENSQYKINLMSCLRFSLQYNYWCWVFPTNKALTEPNEDPGRKRMTDKFENCINHYNLCEESKNSPGQKAPIGHHILDIIMPVSLCKNSPFIDERNSSTFRDEFFIC